MGAPSAVFVATDVSQDCLDLHLRPTGEAVRVSRDARVRNGTTRVVSVVLAAMLAAAPASATGTLNCNARDANLAFEARAVISRGLGSGWSRFSADLTVKAKGFPGSLTRFQFAQDQLVHSWLRGSDIRMVLYAETTDDGIHRWIEVIVQQARYKILVFASDDQALGGKPIILRGRIQCSGDTDE